MTRILGIDHATVHAGYAIFDGEQFERIGAIDLTKSEDSPSYALFRFTRHLIADYDISVVALEKPMAMKNGKTARMLIEAYTGAKLAAEHHGKEIAEVTPQLAKQYTAGHTQAEKEDVARALVAQFKLDIDVIAPPVYYKRPNKKAGQLRHRLYDPSDAAALCVAAWQIRKSEAIGAMAK